MSRYACDGCPYNKITVTEKETNNLYSIEDIKTMIGGFSLLGGMIPPHLIMLNGDERIGIAKGKQKDLIVIDAGNGWYWISQSMNKFNKDTYCIYSEVCEHNCDLCENPRYNRIVEGKLNFDKIKKDEGVEKNENRI